MNDFNHSSIHAISLSAAGVSLQVISRNASNIYHTFPSSMKAK